MKEAESVELQMDIISVSDNECIIMKVLVKVVPLQNDAVNVLHFINVFDSVNELDPAKISELINALDSVDVSVCGRHL